MTEYVVVIGASGFGRESLDVLEAMQQSGADIEILGVVDDAISSPNRERLADRGTPFLGTREEWLDTHFQEQRPRYVLGIGNPLIREHLVEELDDLGLKPFSAIHPSATVGSGCSLGEGSVICAGVAVSTNVTLRRHVHLNPNATIGHDAVLEDFVSINPAAVVSGEVFIRSRSLIGASSIVLQGLSVGPDAVVGASACVTKSVAEGFTVKGVPAHA